MIAFLNAKGGVAGKKLSLATLEMDDDMDSFRDSLDTLVVKGKPHLIVGGAVKNDGRVTADYFRRIGRPWFGPWTDDPDIYAGNEFDPVGLLPSAPLQFKMLFEYAREKAPEGRDIYLILSLGPLSERTAAAARAEARAAGLELKVVTIPADFKQWKELEDYLPNAGTVILWTPPGPSSAIRRVLDKSLPPDTLWMTSALNPPSHEIIAMTAGVWGGAVFPAVLIPSAQIPETHRAVLEKYALPGLKLEYPAFLGFAQGQLLGKALSRVATISEGAPREVVKSLRELSLSGGIVEGAKLPIGAMDPAGAYLAVCDRTGGWSPARERTPEPEETAY
jgi:hypothetical protein